MDVNDNAGCLNPRGVPAFFASRLAPTIAQLTGIGRVRNPFLTSAGLMP